MSFFEANRGKILAAAAAICTTLGGYLGGSEDLNALVTTIVNAIAGFV